MRVSMCVGKYAESAYRVPGPDLEVYSMEELCFVLRENAYLLDTTLLNLELTEWVEEECACEELAEELSAMVRRKGSLSTFVIMILDYVGFYEAEEIRKVESILKRNAGLSDFEKKKRQLNHLVEQKKYGAAYQAYEKWIASFKEDYLPETDREPLAVLLYNQGVICAKQMNYPKAANLFLRANKLDQRTEYQTAFLSAKRMYLEEQDYISLVAGLEENGTLALELEKRLEMLSKEQKEYREDFLWEEYKNQRLEGQKEAYAEAADRLLLALKEGYKAQEEVTESSNC